MSCAVSTIPVAHGGALQDFPAESSAESGTARTRPFEGRPATAADAPASFFDRDLSQLRFQQRVLEEAQDEKAPLLERVKFLSIFGTNLDDFISSRGQA